VRACAVATVYLWARHYQPALGRFLQRDSFPGIPSSPQSLHKYTYAHNNALKHTDPSGNVIPVLLAVGVLIAVAEFSLSVYDAYTTYETVMDPCISLGEKGLTIALFVGGLFLPGGGYASGAKAVGKSVKTLVNNLDHADEVFDATYQARKVFRNTDTAADTANGLDTADDANDLIKATNDGPTKPTVPKFCSFTPDTPVLTINGLLPIGGLTVGTLVWAWDEATQTTGWYTITDTWGHADPVLVDLMIDGDPITTTPEHPFFTGERGWVAASDLRLGDAIRSAAESWGAVERIVLRHQTQVMYNLTVATAHTFFVGEGQWLVHNDCFDFGKSLPNGAAIEALVDNDGVFWTALSVPDALKGQGIGKSLFGDAWDAIGKNATAVGGKWAPGMPDNLNAFNKNIKAGMDIDAAAINTFTGSQAKARGFIKPEFTVLRGMSGDYTEVEVIFR